MFAVNNGCFRFCRVVFNGSSFASIQRLVCVCVRLWALVCLRVFVCRLCLLCVWVCLAVCACLFVCIYVGLPRYPYPCFVFFVVFFPFCGFVVCCCFGGCATEYEPTRLVLSHGTTTGCSRNIRWVLRIPSIVADVSWDVSRCEPTGLILSHEGATEYFPRMFPMHQSSLTILSVASLFQGMYSLRSSRPSGRRQ